MSKNLLAKASTLEGSLNYLFPSTVFRVEVDFLRGVQKLLIFWTNGPSENEVRMCNPIQQELRNHTVALIFHNGGYINVHRTLPPVVGKASRTKGEKIIAVASKHSIDNIDAINLARLNESKQLQKLLGKLPHRKSSKSRVSIVRVSRTQMEMFGPGENKLNYQGKLSFTG